MTDPRVFFQVAAALIPALVFGGPLSDRIRPPRRWESGGWRRWVSAVIVFLFSLAVFYGEIAAIQVGLTGSPDRTQTWAVAGVLAGATAVTVIVVAWHVVHAICFATADEALVDDREDAAVIDRRRAPIGVLQLQ